MLHLRRSLWRKGRLALHQWMLEGETKSDLNKSSWPSQKKKGEGGGMEDEEGDSEEEAEETGKELGSRACVAPHA